MSQGELHSLALAIFLPRALAQHTPFGFVIIDDPVQSMDPAKVDGLAKVLSVVAGHRQVIVFTHDTRLRESVFRLQLPATVMEVTRGERSLVRVRKVEDEVSRALADARGRGECRPASGRGVPRRVAGLCRTALEAARVEVYRRGRLAAGVRHTEVEAGLRDARTLSDLVSLAAFGERRRRDDVQGRLEEIGPWAKHAFRLCNRGVHSAPSAADPMRAQLLCLGGHLTPGKTGLARSLWGQLSQACHYHSYELSPSATELRRWHTELTQLTAALRTA